MSYNAKHKYWWLTFSLPVLKGERNWIKYV